MQASQVQFRRVGIDLQIVISGGEDVLTVTRYFADDARTSSAVEWVRLEDGTEWDIEAIRREVTQGTDGETFSMDMTATTIFAVALRMTSSMAVAGRIVSKVARAMTGSSAATVTTY